MIGIVSFQFEKNYGALLQCFALQQALFKFDESVCHLDYKSFFHVVSPYDFDASFGGKIRWFICLIKSVLKKFLKKNYSWNSEVHRLFNKINLSKKNVFVRSDVLIAGSDQIWNHNFVWGREKIYFLGLGTKSAKRISYAASLGVGHWPRNFEKKILPYLKRFDAISVREEASIPYLESLGLKNIVSVCDPTILHDASFYQKFFCLSSTQKSEPFVYSIWTDLPDCLNVLLTKNADIVKLHDPNNQMRVEEWIASIFNASFVVTDSFHCTVFCILFHKSFIVLENHGKGAGMNERFQTLLRKTELLDQILPMNADKNDALCRLNKFIDWNKVDCIMNEWRMRSLNWLKGCIDKVN
ncbi:MAG: polysaccharide pyruvyl transferase family protein [Candidatus Saccharibacteria bacterium]|nr:polysaccharide pyruvyl transferase family protein [Candidatus Saccharibacteria bacterium]